MQGRGGCAGVTMKWSWWQEKKRRPWLIGGGTVMLLVLLFFGRCGTDSPAPVAGPAGAPGGGAPAPAATPAVTPGEQSPAAGAAAAEARSENRRPEVTAIRLTPALIYPETLVRAEVAASDPEGKEVALSYQWLKNGEPIAEAQGGEYKVEGLRKGDLLQVAVTPHDGEQEGRTVNSVAALILNRPPAITSFPPAGLENGRFRYAVQASDPDGDKLTYALEQPPAGMTVDAATGTVEWDAASAPGGDYQVRLTVSDGEGTTFQVFRLVLTRQ